MPLKSIKITAATVFITDIPVRLMRRHGSGDVALLARREGAELEIDVSDQGPGFSRDLAPRAFERFARGEVGVRGGAGLGLAIVHAIAEAHGGTATIVDGVSGGATVRLRIPLQDPEAR